jgi:exopolysaccharide biosynthesis polyprenyl glycosylphosphotransferase
VKTRLVLTDVVAVVATCIAASWAATRFGWEISAPFLGLGARVVTPTVAALWVVSLAVNGAWDTRLIAAGTDYYVRVLRASLIAFAGTGLFGFLGSIDAARPFVYFAFPIGAIAITASRWLVRAWARKRAPVRRVVILGLGHEGTRRALETESAMRVVVVDVRTRIAPGQVRSWLQETSADAVVITSNHGLSQPELRELVWVLDEEEVDVWFDAATQFIRAGSSVMIPTRLTTLLSFDPVHLSDGQRIMKRGFDLAVSLCALVGLAPVLAVSMVAILVMDGRPIFFRQKRIGRDGKEFSLWKLRTMTEGSGSPAPEGMSKDPEDPRITKIGRVLRRWSIDEIPQFVNVLVGNMSVVGPRPRLPAEVRASGVTARRLKAKPGITGPWQTSGRSLMTLEEADSLDVNYVDSWSLLGDLVIMLRTIRVVFSGRGAF